MNGDVELASWRREWLAQEPPATPVGIDIRRIAERERRRMAVMLGAQFALALVLLVFSAWFVRRRWSAEWILWAGVVWTSTFVATAFVIRNSAGNWRSLDESTAGYVALSRCRCFAELRAVRFGRWMTAVSLAVIIPWFARDYAVGTMPLPQFLIGIGEAGVLSAAYLVWFAVRRRRKLRELVALDEFTLSDAR